ncbi:hypothetical protein [Billgrantia endophytica]|uniref:Uncharacterized protein n=1 Tax=Billgrantia endophytica TaxID=2033802 RepID=A0A2N7U2K7_9GAMM|nr:hypothetical protein [Halomonas endophytica]PMR74675.1 hypothetical protein C1H69_12505 [Halomonas endophytica]
MKVDGGSSCLFASQHANATRMDAKVSFETLLAGETERSERIATQAGSAKIEQADFTNMTRQELRNWMGEQLRSGEMTVDESKAFLGMSAIVHPDPSMAAIVEARMQNERVNFFEAFQSNMEFYRLRGDSEAVERLQAAIDTMHQAQGQTTRFDARI